MPQDGERRRRKHAVFLLRLSTTPESRVGEEPRHDAYAALRERDYRLFVGGWFPASMGLQMQAMALAWEVYQRTDDPLSLGYVGLCRVLPVLLLALPAGQIIDLVSRQRVLVLTQVAFAIISLGIAVACLTRAPIALLYVLVVLSGCARVFNGPVRSSLLPLLVHKDAFHNAVTWNSSAFHLSAMVGPILAGVIIEHAPRWSDRFAGTAAATPVYLLTVLSCLTFAVSGMLMRPRAQETIPRAGVSVGMLAAGMLDGMRFVWRDKIVLGALALDLLAVLIGGAVGLLPVIAEDVLKVGAFELGVLTAAPYAGAVLMGLYLAHRPPFRRAGRALLWSVAGFGLATIVFGLSKNLWLSLAMLFLGGMLDNVSVVIRHQLVPLRTPDALRGRVSAVNSVFIESSNELGKMQSTGVQAAIEALAVARGLAVDAARPIGAVGSVIVGGIGTIGVVLIIARVFPSLRQLGPLREVAADSPPIVKAPGVPNIPA